MRRHSSRLGLLALLVACLSGTESKAQAPGPYRIAPGQPACTCPAYNGPHYHIGGPSEAARGRSAAGGNAVSPNEQGLPRGRRYYGGRYFGSFNNRFYGPQYGYF